MGEVTTFGSNTFRPGMLNVGSYFPSIPPKPPNNESTVYSRSIMEAPYTALVGVIVDAKQPTRLPVTSRYRVRHQVGYTNRWRLPESLGSDLLGTSQAMKAIQQNYSKSVIQIITAENPKTAINHDEKHLYNHKAHQQKISGLMPLESNGRPPSTTSRITVMSIRRPPSGVNTCKPLETFYYHSRRSGTSAGPDVLLNCMDTAFELHRPYIQKSATLKSLLERAEAPVLTKYFKTKDSISLEKHIAQSNHFSNAQKEQEGLPVKEIKSLKVGILDPKLISLPRLSKNETIELKVDDSAITPHGMAVGLGHLYHDDIEIEPQEVISVLAAAVALRFPRLEHGCEAVMLSNVSRQTIGRFYKAAVKYHKDKVITACQRWLEINLVAELSSHVNLREIPLELLQKVLHSNRLFTYSEFALFKALAFWVFLQINPQVQVMPSYSAVVSFFNGLPKGRSLLEAEEGQHFIPLFTSLRLHGVTESSQMHDIQMMNIVPKAWIVKVLTQHYQSLQAGGDMAVITNYDNDAVRQGFILDESEPQYHSELLSLHGFHFELKVVADSTEHGKYSFSIQRLRPGDSLLSFRHSERSTFSMRPERDVKYSMKIQYYKGNHIKTYSTGQLKHTFGLGAKTSKGQVLTMENMTPPLYVSFAFYFPPS